MSRQFEDAFQHQNLLRAWDIVNGNVAVTAGNAGSIETRAYCTMGNVVTNYLAKYLTAKNEFFFGFWMQASSVNTPTHAVRWQNGTTELGTFGVSSGRWRVCVGTAAGNNVVVQGTNSAPYLMATSVPIHYQIHIVLDDTVGLIEVKVNNVLDPVSFSGDTKPGSETTIDRVYLYGITNVSYTCFFDGFVVNDTDGDADNTWPGAVRFTETPAMWDSPTNKGFFRTGGAYANAWEQVDDAPDSGDASTGDWMYGSVDQAQQGLQFPSHYIPSGQIVSVIDKYVMRATDAGVTVKLGKRVAGTDYLDANAVTPPSALGMVSHRAIVNPNTGVAWTLLDSAPPVCSYSYVDAAVTADAEGTLTRDGSAAAWKRVTFTDTMAVGDVCWMEFQVLSVNDYFCMGIGSNATPADYTQIYFTWVTTNTGNVAIYENNVFQINIAKYANAVYRLELIKVNNLLVVRYYMRDQYQSGWSLSRTSTATDATIRGLGTLYCNAHLYTPNCGIKRPRLIVPATNCPESLIQSLIA